MSLAPWREGDTHRIKIKFKPVSIDFEFATLVDAQAAQALEVSSDIISLEISGEKTPYILRKTYQPNITGYKFWMTIKSELANADAQAIVQIFKVVGEGVSDDAENGIVFIELTKQQSDSLVAGKYYYDVQMQTPSGDIKTILPEPSKYKERLVVVSQVTRVSA